MHELLIADHHFCCYVLAMLDHQWIFFPDPSVLDGLCAIGGDLSEASLLKAYSMGMFPWYRHESFLHWFSPDPRMILYPGRLRISHSLQRLLRQRKFVVKSDTDFASVIRLCAEVHDQQSRGTWITGEFLEAYTRLHKGGWAHSIETYRNGALVGGLYGVSLGRAFFGESMFHLVSDASKIALVYLSRQLQKWNFLFVDAQQSTPFMKSFGGEAIPRRHFLELLNEALRYPSRKGKWTLDVHADGLDDNLKND